MQNAFLELVHLLNVFFIREKNVHWNGRALYNKKKKMRDFVV